MRKRKRDRRTLKIVLSQRAGNVNDSDHYGKVLSPCAGCMKTLFKATIKFKPGSNVV